MGSTVKLKTRIVPQVIEVTRVVMLNCAAMIQTLAPADFDVYDRLLNVTENALATFKVLSIVKTG